VPVADEVGRLQRGQDRECLYFQSFAEKGHYAGRVEPTNTRQGIYAIAPSGALLASTNTRSAEALKAMLERALAAWNDLPREQRLLSSDPGALSSADRRLEARFPQGGAALRVTTRDLPSAAEPLPADHDWRRAAWNQDWMWLKPGEVLALAAPAPFPAVGATWNLDPSLPRRIARAHLVDFVRGQTSPYRDEDIERAELRATLVQLEGGVARLLLEGSSRSQARGRWKVEGQGPSDAEQTRGVEATWLGQARWHVAEARLLSLELLAVGSRWGATQYNGRADDPGPAPIGFHFEWTELAPHQRVAPAHLWSYGW
jgi:hypothetical protein